MFWFVARVREPVWMLPVLYVWASVAGVLLPAQVWMLANQVVTTREAKRLFGRDPGLPPATVHDYLTPWSAAKAEKRFLARFKTLHG